MQSTAKTPPDPFFFNFLHFMERRETLKYDSTIPEVLPVTVCYCHIVLGMATEGNHSTHGGASLAPVVLTHILFCFICVKAESPVSLLLCHVAKNLTYAIFYQNF